MVYGVANIVVICVGDGTDNTFNGLWVTVTRATVLATSDAVLAASVSVPAVSVGVEHIVEQFVILPLELYFNIVQSLPPTP